MTPARRALSRRAGLTALALSLAGAATSPALAAAPPAEVRVVVTASSVPAAATAVRAAGGRVVDALPLVRGVSAVLPAGTALGPGVQVTPDRALAVAGRPGPLPVLGAGPRATLGLGAPAGEGRGTTVAVVDTGVADVPGLPRVRHVDVSGDGPGDGFGHGTFVAGLVAGTGTGTGDGAVPAGVAPGADLLDVRVAHDDGSTDLVTVLRGLQAVAAHPEVDVVNLSLSSGSPLPYQLDPLTGALEALWRRGVTVVVPAGNDPGGISSPGSDPLLLTVGGLDEHGTPGRLDDTVAPWSGRGPAPQGVAKPDLLAPGSSLVSLRAPGSAADRGFPAARVGSAGFRGSGSSFSTALTSGTAAALLGRQHLTPDQVKAVLTGTAYAGAGLGGPSASGAGGLDAAAALDARAPRPAQAAAANGDVATPLPGDDRAWTALGAALVGDDPQAALAAWPDLPGDARRAVDRLWRDLDPAMRGAGTAAWAERGWSGASPEQWAARDWAAQVWGSRNWADADWTSRAWASRNWASRNWASRNWASRNWAGADWASRNWAGADWASRNWAGADWASRNWAGAAWASRNWAGAAWASRNWAGAAWAAGAWAAGTWGAPDGA